MLRKTHPIVRFKAINRKTGEFEALVSVFGNVDYQGDRVIKGAFTKSIQNWRKSGDPLPIIWSHDWGNPFAHIGKATPDEMEETDEGLIVRGVLDVHKEFAAQVYDLMSERRVREFSFGYDVKEERPGRDRANELVELDIIEAGPTLKGANPDTQLLGVKTALDIAAKADGEDREATDEEDELIRLAKELGPEGEAVAAALARTDDEEEEAVAEKAEEPLTKNVYAALAGTVEERQSALRSAVEEAFPRGDDDTGYRWSSVVGTWPDRVVVEVMQEGEETQYFEMSYEIDDEGAVTLGEARAVEIELTVVGAEDAEAGAASREPGAKAGRVIGAKAAAALKSTLASAVDEFVAEVNGAARAAADEDEKSREDDGRDPEIALLEDRMRALEMDL